MAKGEKRQIDLDDTLVADGLRVYSASEKAQETWRDWLNERYAAWNIDPEDPRVEAVSYNPFTGRLFVAYKATPDAAPEPASAHATPAPSTAGAPTQPAGSPEVPAEA